jgi:hypothetical protein
VSFNAAEFTMPERAEARGADFLELLSQAAQGLLPGQMLEALIARLEAGK